MSLTLLGGATSQTVYVEILDSTSTTGGRKTGLVYNTSGLTAYYVRAGGSAVAITLATLAAANSAWSSGGFKEVDATNMPGVYRLDVPDAAIAAGVSNVVITIKGATGGVQVSKEIMLTAVDLQDTVRAGLTALPNAAAEAAGGLYTRGSGAGQINQAANGQVDANVARWLNTAVTAATAGVPDTNAKNINNVATTSVTTINANQGTTQPVNFTGTGASALAKSDMVDVAGAAVSTASAQIGVNAVNIGGTAQTGRDIGASVLLSAGTGTGQLDFTSGVVKANIVQLLATAFTESGAGRIVAGIKKFFDVVTPASTMELVTAVTTVTTATNLTNAPTNGDLTTTMKASVNAEADTALSDYGALKPTVAARTLDVTATGEAGLDWANIGAPTTAVDLSGTTVKNVDNAIANVTLVATTTNLTNAATNGDLTATMKTSVKTQAVDALATDTYAEPGQGAPAATATLAAKINYLYKFLRNKKTQTSTTFSLFADDTTTVDQKVTVSDDGTTFTSGEVATGP